MSDLYRIKPFRLLLWWIACSFFVFPLIIVTVAVIAIPSVSIIAAIVPNYYQYSFLETLLTLLAVPVIGAIIGGCMAFLQRWLLRTKLYWAADKWTRWTMIGGAVGASVAIFVANIIQELSPTYYYNDEFFLYLLPIFLGVVSVFQVLALRHAVKQSWLWIIANIVAGIVFAGVLIGNQYNLSLYLAIIVLSVISLGLITGFTMLFLFEKKLLPMQADVGAFEDDETPKSVWDRAI